MRPEEALTDQPPPPPPPSGPTPPSWGGSQPGGYGAPGPAPGYGSPGPTPDPGPLPGGYPGQPVPTPGYSGYTGGPTYPQEGTPGGGGGNKTPLIVAAIVVLLLLIGGGVFLATRNAGTSVTTPTPTARPTPQPTPTPIPTPAPTPTITNQYLDCSSGTPQSVDKYGAAVFADLCAIQPPRDILLARLKAQDLPGVKQSALALATVAQTSLTDLKSQTPTTASERSADVLLKQGLQDVVDGGTGIAAGIDAQSATDIQTSADKLDAGTNLILTQLPKLH